MNVYFKANTIVRHEDLKIGYSETHARFQSIEIIGIEYTAHLI